MLTKADDFPIHQLPEPIATAGSDRNFYDRYFFNGYLKDGSGFFACALGVYPHLNIMDGAFSIVKDGVQRNLRVSKVLHSERLDTVIGPLTIEVVEPLRRLRIQVEAPEQGIRADVTFTGRHFPIEEPRFTHRQGPRLLLDYTRLTQNGHYDGFVEFDGQKLLFEAENNWGTRDRSWGVRPIGASDPQPVAPPPLPQFYWLWSPLNFDDMAVFYHLNADQHGTAWNTKGILAPADGSPEQGQREVSSTIAYKPGTRHAQSAVLEFAGFDGVATRIHLAPQWQFSMSGIGYTHPEWGHGMYKGELAVGYDEYVHGDIPPMDMLHLHVQAFCVATMERGDGSRRQGAGVLEQLVIGPYAPAGFTDLLDGA